MATKKSTGRQGTKKAKKKNTVSSPTSVDFPARKKAKLVKSDKQKIKALAELKDVRAQIDKLQQKDNKRFKAQDKLFTKSQTLREKLGID